MPSLLDPIRVGDFELPNRVIMSPLTRLRGTPEHIPTPVMAEYYAQRAGAGAQMVQSRIDSLPAGRQYEQVAGHNVSWDELSCGAFMPLSPAERPGGVQRWD